MDTAQHILYLLSKLENALQCSLCSKNCKNPVRIKVCGHYYCEHCLKGCKNDHNCPKCNEFYKVTDLDYKNIARESKEDIQKLKKLLSKPKSLRNKTSRKQSLKKKLEPTSKTLKPIITNINNSFFYDESTYHINFVSSPVTKRNSKGETSLHLACKKKKLGDVKKLIDQKVDINIKDYAGWAPLHEAVQSQNLEIVEYLLKNKCLINIPGADYETPLHQAASLGNTEMVKLLLRYGAKKDMVDYNGLKPIDSTKIDEIKKELSDDGKVTKQMNNLVFELFLSSSIFLYCHSIDEECRKQLQACKNIKVVEKIDNNKKLTHFVIKKTHKISFKILQAMLEGFQFLTQDSVNDFVQGNYFINIPEYTFITSNEKLNNGIKKAMLSALLKLPKLFDGINFYIQDHTIAVDIYNLKVNKEYLVKLIKAGGGQVLRRPPATRTCDNKFVHPFYAPPHSKAYRCCNFIITKETNLTGFGYNMAELQHKSSKWLIDCIINFEITD